LEGLACSVTRDLLVRMVHPALLERLVDPETLERPEEQEILDLRDLLVVQVQVGQLGHLDQLD